LTVVGGMVAYTTAEKQICPTAVHMGSQLEWVLRHTAHDVAAGLWACLHPLEILLILVPGTLVHSTSGRYMRYTHLARRSPAGATARSVGRAGPGKSCFCKRHAVSCFAGHWEVQNLFPFTHEICCGPVSAMLRGGGQCRTCCPGVQRPCVLCACICSQPALSALQGLRGLATHVISNFYSEWIFWQWYPQLQGLWTGAGAESATAWGLGRKPREQAAPSQRHWLCPPKGGRGRGLESKSANAWPHL
jgi:hypothetical protein